MKTNPHDPRTMTGEIHVGGQNYLRQHFAALAMQGFVAHGIGMSKSDENYINGNQTVDINCEKIASCAVVMADNLIAELNRDVK